VKNLFLYFFIFAFVTCLLPFGAKQAMGERNMLISVSDDEGTEDITVEEFTYRVLLAQGVECRSLEAKKALAVAIRSCGGNISVNGCKHEDFDVCDSGECCFPLGDEADYSPEYIAECKKAVSETKGEMLLYEEKPAMALQTACASSGTQKCREYPYLSAVPEKEKCEKHKTEYRFSKEELCERLGFEWLTMDIIREDSCLAYGDNKKCQFAVLGGKAIGQYDLMTRLGLNSPEFYIYYMSEGVRTECYGLGSGYGLNICGAEKLANEGKDYSDILEYYFPKLNLRVFY